MKCPFCTHMENKVIDSRLSKDGQVIRRRRECNDCGKRFTTYERIEEVMPQVVKADGRGISAGVRTIVGVSTYGPSRWSVALVNDNGRRTLTRALRMNCGPRTRTRWYGRYSSDTATAADRADFAAVVERGLMELR